MKLPVLIFCLLLVQFASYAQTSADSVQTSQDTINAKPDSSILKMEDFTTFDLQEYNQLLINQALTQQAEEYKKRLISIDNLITSKPGTNLNDISLEFSISYQQNGSIDTFAITIYDIGHFKESENFEKFVQELNLQTLKAVLANAKYINRRLMRITAMQVDYMSSELSEIRSSVNFDNMAYAAALLTYIHKILANNKTKLGITNMKVYETSYEPVNAGLEDKIVLREKFIRYVSTKL